MNLTADDVKTIISAGFKAKCHKVEYNGLIITYSNHPSFVVAQESFETTPARIPTQADDLIAQVREEQALEDLMLTDPLQYEQRLALEDTNNHG